MKIGFFPVIPRGEHFCLVHGKIWRQSPLVIAHTSICLAIIAVTVAVIAWLSTLYHMIQMACRRQPGAPPRGFIMTNPFNITTNPFNIVFFPGDLTPRGRQHRKRFLISAIVFGAALGGNAVLIGVGRLLQN
jgi:hypothetical protein